MRADGPSVKVMERAYVTDRIRHTKMTAAGAREEFRRGIKTVERAAAEKAWNRCVGEMPIDPDWKNFYGDNNPYRAEAYRGEKNDERLHAEYGKR